jgi:hypothetical protein
MRTESIAETSYLGIVDLKRIALRCASCQELLGEEPRTERIFCAGCIDRAHVHRGELETGGES